MFTFDGGGMVPVLAMMIPIVAIAGGITAGIVQTLSRHRLMELAQRERIAAIEHGVDPSKLPPLPVLAGSGDDTAAILTPGQSARHRARGLLAGGVVTLAVGLGLGLMLYFLTDASDQGFWAVGLIPFCIGLALLVSSWLMQRAGDDEDRRSGSTAAHH